MANKMIGGQFSGMLFWFFLLLFILLVAVIILTVTGVVEDKNKNTGGHES
jgi:uncharacterized membrane protein